MARTKPILAIILGIGTTVVLILAILSSSQPVARAQPPALPQEAPAWAIQAPAAFTHATAAITSNVVAITSSVFGLSVTQTRQADHAIITARGANLSFTSGQDLDPASSNGRLLVANDEVTIAGNADIAGLRFIQESATVTVTITLLKFPGS